MSMVDFFSSKSTFSQHSTCADPESFVRGGPTFFLLMRGEDPSTTIRGPSFVDDGPTFNACLVAAIFQGDPDLYC